MKGPRTSLESHRFKNSQIERRDSNRVCCWTRNKCSPGLFVEAARHRTKARGCRWSHLLNLPNRRTGGSKRQVDRADTIHTPTLSWVPNLSLTLTCSFKLFKTNKSGLGASKQPAGSNSSSRRSCQALSVRASRCSRRHLLMRAPSNRFRNTQTRQPTDNPDLDSSASVALSCLVFVLFSSSLTLEWANTQSTSRKSISRT